MAVKDTDYEEVTEPTEEEDSELDQPDENSYVSLDELSDDGTDDDADDEGESDESQKSGDADRGDGKVQEGFRTQADFDKAFGQRSAGLRRQWEREHAEELAIANAVRRRYNGKSAAEIQEAMIQDQARELAADTGYSESEALKMVRARIEYDQRASAPDNVDPKVLSRLAQQMDHYQEKYGIDLQAEMEADESLLEFASEDGDLGGVMVEVMARRNAKGVTKPKESAKPNRREVPKPVTSGATRAASGARKMTDADIDRIDRAAQRGAYVRLD